jgi:predicted AlkP superfamily pyrophosphatase or phosphodiesterase
MHYAARQIRLLFWAVLLLPLGCSAARRPLHIHVNADVEIPEKCALVFFVDGLDYATLQRMLAAGELPNIQRVFAENGVRIENAVTSLPPITYPNSVSLITGCFPGHHGITGNYWFDRYSLTYRDYLRPGSYRSAHEDFRQSTIYEMLYDEFTFNLQCHTRRGVSHSFDNWLLGALNWSVGTPRVLDTQVGADLEPLAAIANRVRRWPALIWSYYPGVDETGHRHGVNSPQYAAALRNLDAQVARMTAALDEAGCCRGRIAC